MHSLKIASNQMALEDVHKVKVGSEEVHGTCGGDTSVRENTDTRRKQNTLIYPSLAQNKYIRCQISEKCLRRKCLCLQSSHLLNSIRDRCAEIVNGINLPEFVFHLYRPMGMDENINLLVSRNTLMGGGGIVRAPGF